MFKELAQTVGEADAPLLVAGVPISNRDEYLVNPKLSVCLGGGEGSGPRGWGGEAVRAGGLGREAGGRGGEAADGAARPADGGREAEGRSRAAGRGEDRT
jgi:hypothetical protein